MRIKDFILVCITTAIMFPMTTLKAQNMEKEKQLPEYLSAFPFMGHRTKRILRIERKEYQTY